MSKKSRRKAAKAARTARDRDNSASWNLISFLLFDHASTFSILLTKFNFTLTIFSVWLIQATFALWLCPTIYVLIWILLVMRGNSPDLALFIYLAENKYIFAATLSLNYFLLWLAAKAARTADANEMLYQAVLLEVDDQTMSALLLAASIWVDVLQMEIMRVSLGNVAVLIAGMLIDVFVIGW